MEKKQDMVRITYIETVKTKKWMNKHLDPQEQSGFIRDAVAEKIAVIEEE